VYAIRIEAFYPPVADKELTSDIDP